MTVEAAFAAGYGVFLLCAAFALEWLSEHTHRRALRYRTAGFDYDETQDFWLCPEGEHLWPHEFDREKRLVRYRAKAQVCNACPVKERCTDSHEGREVVRPLDPWPHSEAGRFHRVISVTLVVLAALVLVVEVVRNHEPLETGVLLGLVAVSAFALQWLVRDLRLHPANFPEPTPSSGLRVGASGPPAGR